MTLVERYEQWFQEGKRPLGEFLNEIECDGSELRELILTDQHLRHEAGLSYSPIQYASLGDVDTDGEFQLELWLEALGYAEEDGVSTETFLAQIPDAFREDVRSKCIGAAASPHPIVRPPTMARYRIDRELGRGAFGVVYEAWDHQLDRAVAVKVLRAGTREKETDFAEARLVAGLDHPGLVSVYDCGHDQHGQAFLVTQLVEGRSLSDWAEMLDASREVERRRICELFSRLCDALAAAHQRGVVHRDLKPGNVLVRDQDQPVVLDFGLALSDWRPGREGEWVGTPAYMSPEQARGEGHLVDPRSDLFAVGILLFEALTGERPWRSESTQALLREIAHGSVRSLRQLKLEIPVELESICRKATAASMPDRYASAKEMSDDLRWFLESGGRQESLDSVKGIRARGLRPYTSDDSESFWTLLPGYRNARGVPESVAWWLRRLQDENDEPRRAVLVLYGPSGSGKSSLLHAGVLPFLDSRRSLVCALDASEFESTAMLVRELSETTKLESGSSLPEFVGRLRDRSSRPTLITIDQFEQVLAWDVDEREQMVFALRQADGARLQFVLVVRDEFWTAMSRLMRDLDSALRDHRNAMGLERFSATHAKHVLRTWAESAPPGSEIDDDFVDSAIKLVEEKNRVIPVRLALLVSVLGEEPWTAARLADVAKRGSLSACYLDSILGAESSAEGRRLSEPARRVLRALTPVTGLIRGPARSTEELHDISGLDNAEFEDLLDLLNRRSHLMTPVDRADEATTRATSIDYNLAHDFLVPELRSWLEELERTTARGRAALDLRAAAQRWSVEASSTQLAGPIDCLRFGFLASPTDERERRFLRASARRGLSRSMVVAVVAIAAAVLFQYALLRNSGNALVKRLGDCDVNQLSDVIDETRDNWLFTERPLRDAIRGAVESGNFPKQDRFSLALLATEPEQANYLSDRLLRCEPELLRQILAQMRSDLDGDDLEATVDRFASVASEESYITGQRLRAAIAVAALDPEHAFWRQSANSICELLVASDPTEIGWMADGLWPIRTSLIPELKRVVSDNGSEQLRTATFLLAKFATDDDVAMVEILENAGLSQLSAVAPAIRAASDSVNSRLNERLEELLDAYLNVALDMELQSLAPTRAQPDGGENLLAKRRVLLARRIANVAALMLQRGCGETCLELLRSSSDPTLRSYVIHCYAVSEGPAEPLADVLVGKTESAQEATIESGIAAALLQTLGSLPASSQVPLAVRDLARRWSRISDNMELRSSATFFLCHQGYADSVGEVSLDENSVAYRTVAGQAMVRLPAALNATVGASPWDASQLANEQTHRISVPDHLYVSRHEVTVEQFNQFLQSRGRPLMDARSGSGSTTAIRIGFYQAAAFCNWLSEQEDIPEADWCFVPNASGHYAAGMSIAKDHLSRQGYQLPTADLWEYACRAGSSTPRHYGYGIELSTPYVRWMGSRSGASRNPMSVRKPNGFGLFDMLGNASEWSLTVVSDTSANYPSMNSERASQDPGRFLQRASRPGLAFGGGPEHEDASGKTITDRTRFLMLGGSFDSPAHKVRSSDRSMVSPPITNQPIGIRLMRIVREEVR